MIDGLSVERCHQSKIMMLIQKINQMMFISAMLMLMRSVIVAKTGLAKRGIPLT